MTDRPIGFSVADWCPPPAPSADPMTGRYCRLERLDADRHAPSLFDAHAVDADGHNWTYLPHGPFDLYGDYYDWLSGMAKQNDPFFFTIMDATSQRATGIASYLRITPTAGTIEVGHIHYTPLLQKTPAASEAMFLMMKRVFELGYRRYEWKCDALNAPSRRAALRLGFSYEGVFRQATNSATAIRPGTRPSTRNGPNSRRLLKHGWTRQTSTRSEHRKPACPRSLRLS